MLNTSARMKFHILKLFLLLLLLCSAINSRKISRTRIRFPSTSSRQSSTKSNTGFGKSSSSDFLFKESGRPSLPAPKVSSPLTHSNFPSAPSYPRDSHTHLSGAPWQKPVVQHPFSPSPSTNAHNTHEKPGIVHNQYQQSSAPLLHSDPYGKQPAQNPYFSNPPHHPTNGYNKPSDISHAPQNPHLSNPPHHPTNGYNKPSDISHASQNPHLSNPPYHPTNGYNKPSDIPHAPQNPHFSNTPYNPTGGYNKPGDIASAPPHGISLPTFTNTHHVNSAPYPTNLPNHPHPNPSIGSSSFPTNSNPPPNHINTPVHSQTYPNIHSSHSPVYNVPHPSYNSMPVQGSPYHSGPIYSSSPIYHPPSQVYQPPSTPFIPGKPVYIIKDSDRSGPGIGSMIATGVAAGATSAIVDNAISSIFRSGSHVHTYPSPPVMGTPTAVTHTTNNYYYGSSPNNGNSDVNHVDSTNTSTNQQRDLPTAGHATQNESFATLNTSTQTNGNQRNPGATNVVNVNQENPSMASNGAVSKTPQDQLQNSVINNGFIPDEELLNFTEVLFDKLDKTNLFQYVDLSLQKRVTNVTQILDEAPEPLFSLKPELDIIPTVSLLRALYDNYQQDGSLKEIISLKEREEEIDFIDKIVETPIMTRALNWLVDKKLIESDGYEQKDLLRRMWFTTFFNMSSGFERIFLSEKFNDTGIVGLQNWIYFAHLESHNRVNYLGYVETLHLSGKGVLLKLNYQTEGFTIQNATIFIGTPPELELALYTICFHARPNDWCPISLGGAKFFILTHSFRYYGKDLIDLGFPAF